MVVPVRVSRLDDRVPAAAPARGDRAQPVPDRARGRRLALVREATAPATPKTQGIRHARTGHSRPHEALLDLIDVTLDHTPPWAVHHAAAQWLALLDDLAGHVRRRAAGAAYDRAERDYARHDDE